VIVVKIDMHAVDECVRTSPEWRSHCEHLAAKGLAHARSTAPVKTGAYKASLYAEVGSVSVPDAVQGAPATRIGTSSDHGLEVEFQRPARHLVLLHTLDYLGAGG
jgi:hypothetical protein